MPIAIIGAMEEEVEVFRSLLTDEKERKIAHISFIEGKIHGKDVIVLQSGIGKVNAAMTATMVLEKYNPRAIINTGSAGGFAEQLEVGDIVISTELVQHDVDLTSFNYAYGQVPGLPETIPADKELILIAEQAMEKVGLPYESGLIGSSDVFMEDPEKVETVRGRFPTMLAAEMEGAAIAQVCYQYNVPFVVIRSLSDIAGKESSVSFDEFIQTASKHAGQCIEQMLKSIE